MRAWVGGLGVGVFLFWNEPKDPPVWLVQTFVVASIAALAVGLANVLHSLRLEGVQRIVALGTIGMVLLTAALLTCLSFITDGFRDRVDESELLVRLIAAGSIVSACGLLAITIFLAANRRALVTTSAAVKEIRSVKVTCPRCATKTDAAVGAGGGRSRCGGCGLIFVLELAEPRCVKCEYNLLDLKGDICPECGTPVSESVGAGSAASA